MNRKTAPVLLLVIIILGLIFAIFYLLVGNIAGFVDREESRPQEMNVSAELLEEVRESIDDALEETLFGEDGKEEETPGTTSEKSSPGRKKK